jgi:hypothetical protein
MVISCLSGSDLVSGDFYDWEFVVPSCIPFGLIWTLNYAYIGGEKVARQALAMTLVSTLNQQLPNSS